MSSCDRRVTNENTHTHTQGQPRQCSGMGLWKWVGWCRLRSVAQIKCNGILASFLLGGDHAVFMQGLQQQVEERPDGGIGERSLGMGQLSGLVIWPARHGRG